LPASLSLPSSTTSAASADSSAESSLSTTLRDALPPPAAGLRCRFSGLASSAGLAWLAAGRFLPALRCVAGVACASRRPTQAYRIGDCFVQCLAGVACACRGPFKAAPPQLFCNGRAGI